MERLTDKEWRNFDPWECCGQDGFCKRGCHDSGGCNNGCIVPKLYKRLAQYEDEEEQGRMIVLPCNVGDTVYYIKTLQNGVDTKVIEQDTVKRIIIDGINIQIVISYSHAFMMCDFNRLLFLSREEAEKALEGTK